MSYNFEQMNKKGARTMCPGVNSRDLGEIRNLKDFLGCTVCVDGFFFSHSKKYNNDQVVIAGTVMAKNPSGNWEKLGQFLMNTPGRTYDEFLAMSENEEALKDILLGKLYITNIEMTDTKSGSTVIYKYRTGKARYEDVKESDDFMSVDDDDELPFD